MYTFKTSTPYSQSVKVDNLELCGISPAQEGVPESINICGTITNNEPGTTVRLLVYLYKMPNKVLVSRVEKDNKNFEEGPFTRELSLESTHGKYLVEIYLFREKIGSLEFSVP